MYVARSRWLRGWFAASAATGVSGSNLAAPACYIYIGTSHWHTLAVEARTLSYTTPAPSRTPTEYHEWHTRVAHDYVIPALPGWPIGCKVP
jgi:hypothetical protein